MCIRDRTNWIVTAALIYIELSEISEINWEGLSQSAETKATLKLCIRTDNRESSPLRKKKIKNAYTFFNVIFDHFLHRWQRYHTK